MKTFSSDHSSFNNRSGFLGSPIKGGGEKSYYDSGSSGNGVVICNKYPQNMNDGDSNLSDRAKIVARFFLWNGLILFVAYLIGKHY